MDFEELKEQLSENDGEDWSETILRYFLDASGTWLTTEDACERLSWPGEKVFELLDRLPIYAQGLGTGEDFPINQWILPPNSTILSMPPNLFTSAFQCPSTWRFKERDVETACLLRFPDKGSPLLCVWRSARMLLKRWAINEERLNIMKNNEYSGLRCFTLHRSSGLIECKTALERIVTDLHLCLFAISDVRNYELKHKDLFRGRREQRLDKLFTEDLGYLGLLLNPDLRPADVLTFLAEGGWVGEKGPHSVKLIREWLKKSVFKEKCKPGRPRKQPTP
jgi:hypothetical protein